MDLMASLLIAVLCRVCLSQDAGVAPRPVPPHLHASAHGFFQAQAREQTGLASMSFKVLRADAASQDVEVSWSNAPERQLHQNDWIGAFDPSVLTEFHAPVKFKYAFAKGTKWPNLPSNGSMTFTLLNIRSQYVFMYVSGNSQYPAIIAQSQLLSFSSVTRPMGFHVAVSPTDPSIMLVMWTQKSPSKPTVKFGLDASAMNRTVQATRDTYTKSDFCDTGISPAARQGWFEPGYFLTAEVPVQPGQTIFYQAGDDEDNMSEIRNFTVPPAADDGPTRLILLADMGNAPSDGALHHSWDFDNHGEIPSLNTSRLAKHLLDKEQAHAVVHVGDVSYAVGYLSEWDEFMAQIEPVASRIPWMVSVGNHEIGWSQSDPFDGALQTSMDSGGECGVATLKRFPYAMQPQAPGAAPRDAEPWYSFNAGLVHFTMLSSEHDFSLSSAQWKWMVDDLSKVDRAETPWVAVTSHRPMYLTTDYDGDTKVGKLLSDNVEDQLLKFGVDFFISGHHHSYQRFCKINKGKCVDDSDVKGFYPIVIGMAGYDHSYVKRKSSDIARVVDDSHWGATYWEFNKTVATMKFLDGATEEVIDSYSFKKASPDTATVMVV